MSRYLGTFSFLGVDFRPEQVDIPPGFEMNWTWSGDASSYGGVVQSYRYGWDIEDLNDPTDWERDRQPVYHYIRAR